MRLVRSHILLGVQLATILLAAAALLWIIHAAYRAQEDFQRGIAAHSVTDVAGEIAEVLEQMHASADLLAQSEGALLSGLAARPDDAALSVRLEGLLSIRFPDFHAFALADASGSLLTDDFGEAVGEQCRADLRRFAASGGERRSLIHPGPKAYHYDVMVNWAHGDRQGILFIGLAPDYLAHKLARHQMPGHRLMLVRSDQPRLVEITPAGSRERLGGAHFLDDAVEARVADLGSRAQVEGALWSVVDAPEPDLLAQAWIHTLWLMLGVLLASLALGVLTVRVALREARNRRDIETRHRRDQEELERRVAERSLALAQSESRFARLFDQVSTVAVQGYAPDGTVRYWNPASATLYGYTKEEALGRNLLELIIPPAMREPVRDAVRAMTESGQALPAEELVLMHKDGSPVPVYSSHVLLDNPEGERELFCLDVDLRERKAAEALIERDREQQATLRALLEVILKGEDLEGTLDRCLDLLLSVSWLSLLPKGGIFLMGETGGSLRLAVAKNLAPEILEQCATLPVGRCLCGRAAGTGEMQYTACVNAQHEVAYPGMVDHGHYSMPIRMNEEMLGVLVLYLPLGFRRDPVKEEFIASVADVLAGFICRKRDELVLQASGNLTRSIMDSLRSAIAVLNEQGEIIQVNQAWRRFALDNGGDARTVAGVGLNYLEACSSAIHAGDADARSVVEGIRGVMQGRLSDYELEYPCDGPDQPRWFYMRVTPLQGTVGGRVVLSHADITERKRMEQALEAQQVHLEEVVALRTASLKAEEEKTRLILQSSADGVFGLDTEGHFTFVNPAACRMLGFAAAELIGQLAHVLIHHTRADGAPYPAEDCPMHRALDEARLVRVERDVLWRRDGQPLQVDYAATPIFKEDRIVGVVVSFRDIAERQRMEDAMRQALVAAQQLAQAKSAFLANMSHEIRTPLNAVLGLARIGARDSAGREAESIFTRILDAGAHLLGVINDILDISKIEAGKISLESRPFLLASVIDHVGGFIADAARQKGLVYEATVSEDLPEWVSGDIQRLRQILINLLSNAVKFTEHGEIRLRVAREGEDIFFKVTDTGIGMSEEQLLRLFRPFEQVDSSTTRKFGGTGLGLAISRDLARMMGGEITVDSAPGAGSTFTLHLPLPRSVPLLPDLLPVKGNVPRLSGLRLLAAEDMEVNRLILEDLLVGEGAQLVLAENGRQAVERLEEAGVSAFDAVLMDVQMPVMDGYEATRCIRELAPALPVIGLTAHALAEERDKCLAAGMVEHVTKPIDTDVLVAAILRHTRRPDWSAGTRAAMAQAPLSPPQEPDTPATTIVDAIDWAQLEARFNGKRDFVARLAKTALASHAEAPARLRAAVASGDAMTLAFLAHSLKGLGGNLMAEELRTQAAETEMAVKRGDPAQAELAERLARAAERLLADLGRRLGEEDGHE